MNGFNTWLLQRLTAIYIGLFIVVAVVTLITTDVTWIIWKGWFTTTWIQLSVFLLAFSLLLHAWIGARDVIVDYVHPLALRLFSLSIVALFLIANGFWLLSILWGRL